LADYQKIESIKFSTIDFSKFDLFIVLDSSSWYFASGMKKKDIPNIPLIVIDHHKTNTKFGDLNLIDANVSSTAEILYLVFKDWGIEINKNMATNLLTGIIGDTGVFKFPGTTARTLAIAKELMTKGADKDKIVFHLYFSLGLNQFKFWGEVLRRMQLDKEHKFVWSAIPYETFIKYGGREDLKESAASMFFQSVKGSDFGVVMLEEEKGKLNVSLRSRTGLDVSLIAAKLGGGGHRYAAGGGVEGLSFDKMVEKVLKIVRKFTKDR
jgi:phosphoesterase RecJ-like protein